MNNSGNDIYSYTVDIQNLGIDDCSVWWGNNEEAASQVDAALEDEMISLVEAA